MISFMPNAAATDARPIPVFPLLALRRIEKKENVDANLIAKLEYFNPAGSVKDRVAKEITYGLFK